MKPNNLKNVTTVNVMSTSFDTVLVKDKETRVYKTKSYAIPTCISEDNKLEFIKEVQGFVNYDNYTYLMNKYNNLVQKVEKMQASDKCDKEKLELAKSKKAMAKLDLDEFSKAMTTPYNDNVSKFTQLFVLSVIGLHDVNINGSHKVTKECIEYFNNNLDIDKAHDNERSSLKKSIIDFVNNIVGTNDLGYGFKFQLDKINNECLKRIIVSVCEPLKYTKSGVTQSDVAIPTSAKFISSIENKVARQILLATFCQRLKIVDNSTKIVVKTFTHNF